MSSRRKTPHPRAAVSCRISAEEYRSLMGRGLERGRKIPVDAVLATCESEPLSDLPYKVVLPFLPPSINSIFVTTVDRETGRTRRVLSAKARKSRKAIGQFVHGRLDPKAIYELRIGVELPTVTKSGNIRKIDLTNRVKFLEDCISACLGIDDRQFFRVVLTKVDAEHERTLIQILPFDAQASLRDAA